MKFGLHVPLFGPLSNPRRAAELAIAAEASGWDGLFVWDHIAPPWHPENGDAWVSLAAMAAATTRIRVGPMVTPLPRRRPWKVAREAVALDLLSGGRVTFGAGIGGFRREFDDLGEERDRRARALMLDEGLAVISGLWTGELFSFAGNHYTVSEQQFLPRPLQTPRIPIWIGGHDGVSASVQRAARWDGFFPSLGNVTEAEAVARLGRVQTQVRAIRGDAPFDLVRGGETDARAPDDRHRVSEYESVGVTWWMENLTPTRWASWTDWPEQAMFHRVLDGPPS